jgi:hypothetical protein
MGRVSFPHKTAMVVSGLAGVALAIGGAAAAAAGPASHAAPATKPAAAKDFNNATITTPKLGACAAGSHQFVRGHSGDFKLSMGIQNYTPIAGNFFHVSGETSYLLRITCAANGVRSSDAVVAVKNSGQAYLVHEGLSNYNYGVIDFNVYHEGVDNVYVQVDNATQEGSPRGPYGDGAAYEWDGHTFVRTHEVQ